jgi:hypothetical protein
VPHAEALLAFCDALVDRDEPALAAARAGVLAGLGPEGLVDVAAVASNFERIVRIADACGIPLDPPLEVLSGDLRGALGLARFASAANTPPPGPLVRLLGPLARPLARWALRSIGRGRQRTTPPPPGVCGEKTIP